MKCPSCNFIFFRSAKKCPSCNGGLSRASFAEQPDEEFSIYAAAAGGGLGLDDGDSFGGGDTALDESLYSSGTDTFDGPDSPDDFDLDLSDAEAGDNMMADSAAAEPESPVEDTLDFDLGTGEFSDVDVDGMGIDLEVPEETPGLDLDLGDDPEPAVELDLGDDDAAPEVSLDLDDEPEIDLDLGDDTVSVDTEPELDLDLDLGGVDDTPAEAAPAVEESTSADDGLDLDIDGLELDLDLGDDEDK